MTERNFEELNLWQRIFAEHWEAFAEYYERDPSSTVMGLK